MVDEHVYVKLDKPAAPAVSAPTVFTNTTSQSTSDFKDLNEYNIDDDLDNLLKDL
jgi:hypothetical protein